MYIITLTIQIRKCIRHFVYFVFQDVKDLAKHLFWEVIGDMAKEVSEDLIQGALMISNGTQDVCDIIVEEVVTEYVGYVQDLQKENL